MCMRNIGRSADHRHSSESRVALRMRYLRSRAFAAHAPAARARLGSRRIDLDFLKRRRGRIAAVEEGSCEHIRDEESVAFRWKVTSSSCAKSRAIRAPVIEPVIVMLPNGPASPAYDPVPVIVVPNTCSVNTLDDPTPNPVCVQVPRRSAAIVL